jgi:thiamine-phosphate pyrophosphorylase
MTTGLERILDANLNRAREGLRVGEELARFVLEHAGLQRDFKALRHALAAAGRAAGGETWVRARKADRDPGADVRLSRPAPRRTPADLARANLRRAEEALRVLEELSALHAPADGRRFQRLRFRAYVLEQRLLAALTGGRRAGR